MWARVFNALDFVCLILINYKGAMLTQGCIRELYLNNRCETRLPCVQLLDFQESEANEKEISIRISDGMHFIDCTLSGNYLLTNNNIVEIKNGTAVTTFKRYHTAMIDFFSKIDQSRIVKLKIMIRKMHEGQACGEVIGAPQEIQQFMVNLRRGSTVGSQVTAKKAREEKERESEGSNRTETVTIKIESHIEPESVLPPLVNTQPKIQKKQQNNENQGLITQSLTLAEILSGKQGFLIGRLTRLKATRKETKDGPMSVCYLGLTDRQGQLIRVHLAGRIAMNNQKNLRKGKSYYIRGFDVVSLKNNGPQIRLKDKQYKIVQIHNQELTRQLPLDCYRWDHLMQQKTDSDYVDVIGLIQDIEEKATYTPNSQSKSVIRIVVRNRVKSIRISFWSDQIRNFQTFNLKRKEWIIVEDIKRKHSKYYDFTFQSNLIHLAQFPFLMERFKDFFPPPAEEISPNNVKELELLFLEDPGNTKLQTIRAYLSGFRESKLTYRLCDECKKKVEKEATNCEQCGSSNLVFKYNCPLEFSDSTGSMVAVLFDTAAQRLIGKSASQLNELDNEEVQRLFEGLLYRYYVISVENRNQRLIVRNAEPLDQNQESAIVRQNLEKISTHCLREIW